MTRRSIRRLRTVLSCHTASQAVHAGDQAQQTPDEDRGGLGNGVYSASVPELIAVGDEVGSSRLPIRGTEDAVLQVGVTVCVVVKIRAIPKVLVEIEMHDIGLTIVVGDEGPVKRPRDARRGRRVVSLNDTCGDQ